MRIATPLGLGVIVFCVAAPECCAQQTMVTTSTPFQRNGTSFVEGSNIGWSLGGPGFFARFNQSGVAPPRFGFGDPNSGLSGGFGTNAGGFQSRLNFNFFQSSSRSSSSVTPVLTTTNGYPGSIFVGSRRPFVTGLIPVGPGGGFGNGAGFGVGAPQTISPLQQKISAYKSQREPGLIMSSRQTPAVEETPANPFRADALPPTREERETARSQAQSFANAKVAGYVTRAEGAIQEGKTSNARMYLRLAMKYADQTQRQSLRESFQQYLPE